MSHQLWHENITFIKLNDVELVRQHLQQYGGYGLLIGVLLAVAAMTKSAQIPFSSWLPRAMEGPTTSSAIFYGSLSVHLGVFLLLRTYPYWESMTAVKVLIIAVGLLTSIIAATIASVQSSVKTQIAYSSITQIGIIFIEVAMGFHTLALIHFSGNALLRTYQLLVSPSVLSYLVHDMFFNFMPGKKKTGSAIITKIRNSFYILSVKEWNFDYLHFKYLWNPFKWMGKNLRFLTSKAAIIVLAAVFFAGLYVDINPEIIQPGIYGLLPIMFSILGLLLVLRSFSERGDARNAWGFVIAGQLFIALSIALFHDDFGHDYMLIYLSGALVSFVIGYICLNKIATIDNDIQLNRFHGYTYEKPTTGIIFLLCCLGLVGLPFTPTFIGIDLLFSHIGKEEILLIVLTALSFIFMELAVIRIYARVFLGQHKKAYHPIAFRSS
jgi:NADH:ubiquinone oxidoreductase subunit 5 (subunit L)/multisubunit Na+/H+ antiporter MnhA subunit